MPVNAGKMRHRATLQRPTETTEPGGDVSRGWTDLATVWCSIRPLRGAEYIQAQAQEAKVSHEIHVRFSAVTATLTPADRLQHEGRTFNIVSVFDRDEMRTEMVLMCEEVV